jgi:hypothetical protein
VPADIYTDNDGAWSGDHIMDHEVVPGVVVSNRPFGAEAWSLRTLAAAVLGELGVQGFPGAAGARPPDS